MWFEGRFKVVFHDNNVWVSHSIHLVNLLQTLLAILNALLHEYVHVCEGEGDHYIFIGNTLS